MLKINEIFLSIQGESISTGYPTIFVRLTGCNLNCSYCDTTYSHQEGAWMTIDEIMDKIAQYPFKRVCLTGGEPLLQEKAQVQELLNRLAGYEVNIETNGSIDLSQFSLMKGQRFTMDIKTPSSGESRHLNTSNFDYLLSGDEIKCVIGNRHDYDWVKNILKQYHQKGIVTLSPVFGRINPEEMIQWILEDQWDVRFQLQLHKIIWHPEERGV